MEGACEHRAQTFKCRFQHAPSPCLAYIEKRVESWFGMEQPNCMLGEGVRRMIVLGAYRPEAPSDWSMPRDSGPSDAKEDKALSNHWFWVDEVCHMAFRQRDADVHGLHV